ncbi:MAG: hypothetical protein ACK56E_05265, partial [Planctomyces sp.]
QNSRNALLLKAAAGSDWRIAWHVDPGKWPAIRQNRQFLPFCESENTAVGSGTRNSLLAARRPP